MGGPAPDASPDDINQCLNGSSCPTGTFPWGFIPGNFLNIQLDIVGFLAILGEATVLNNGQVAALSYTSFIPRLMPAPQALLRTQRPERLQPATGTVVGPHSGNIRRHVNHVAQILHQVAFHQHKLGSPEPAPYHVRAIKVDWAEDTSDRDIKAVTQKAAQGGPNNAKGKKRKLKAKFRITGPLAGLAFFGCAQSIFLFVYSIVEQDGMSLLATIILSLVSTLTGVANYWKLELPTRTEQRGDLPASDVIIGYPNGSFLVVTCPEEISRIYFQSEQCKYWIDTWKYRGICLIATVMLMLGVICLANATQNLQISWAANFIAINAAYWGVAALPTRMHWDMSAFKTDVADFKWYCYEKKSSGPNGGPAEYAPPTLLDLKESSQNPTYTEALWKAIGASGGSHWARTTELAPDTNGWDVWLKSAEQEMDSSGMGKDLAKDKMGDGIPNEADVASRKSDVRKSDVERGVSKVQNNPFVLPKWNYREELTKAMKVPVKSRWNDFQAS